MDIQSNNPLTYFDTMLEIARVLSEEHPLPQIKESYLRILEATIRKNVFRSQSIGILLKQKWLAPNALELARNVIEDAIQIEYIFNDIEKRADRFIAYEWVESKKDFEHFKASSVSTDDLFFKGAEAFNNSQYEKVIKTYPGFKNNKNWAGCSVDQMIDKLTEQLGGDEQKRIIIQAYDLGSRHTHFSPGNVRSYLDPKNIDPNDQQARNLALVVTPALLVRMCSRYLDEIDKLAGESSHKDMRNEISATLQGLHSLTQDDLDTYILE